MTGKKNGERGLCAAGMGSTPQSWCGTCCICYFPPLNLYVDILSLLSLPRQSQLCPQGRAEAAHPLELAVHQHHPPAALGPEHRSHEGGSPLRSRAGLQQQQVRSWHLPRALLTTKQRCWVRSRGVRRLVINSEPTSFSSACKAGDSTQSKQQIQILLLPQGLTARENGR